MFFPDGDKSVRTKLCTEQQSGNSFHLPTHVAHTQKGLETVLPGICFTVVFSGNNILKELPTSNPGMQKNKGGYRVRARLARGCTGCTWPPIWALSRGLCGDLQHRGARAELHHHGTSWYVHVTDPWIAISPAVYRTLLTHWARIAHATLQSLVDAKFGQNIPPLTPSRLPQRQNSNSLPIQDSCPLPSHAYTCCQEPSWSIPYHTVNGFLSNRPEVSTGLKRKSENYINAGAFYSTLSQPSTCLYDW